MRRTILMIGCASLLALAFPSQAGNIAWVSLHSADNTPSTPAANLGFTFAPDRGYTTLLTANGHTVTRIPTADNATAASLALLNTFDLVIISRSVPSGHYETNPENAAWNGIAAPLMLINGYVARSNRLGFVTANNVPDITNSISLTINDPSHPIFEGVTLDQAKTMVNPYAGMVQLSFTNLAQRGLTVNLDPAATGGTVLATVGTPGNTFGGTVIAEWEAGELSARGTPFAGPRLLFLTGSREASGWASDAAGVYDLMPDGERLFLNAVDYMLEVPEPSSTVLLALGVVALLVRRRIS